MNILELDNQSKPVLAVSVTASFTPMFVRKGFKKAPFINGVDDPKFRKTQVDLTFTTEENSWTKTYLTFSKDWQNIVWPSIKAALPDMKDTDEIDGMWEIENVETGETYTNREGEVKPSTAPKFLCRVGDNQFDVESGNVTNVPF